jgi:hypothetical protein
MPNRHSPGDAFQEEWRAVLGFEGYYEVSDLGAVRSRHFDPPQPKKHRLNCCGYPVLVLYGGGKRRTVPLHRLVAEVFRADQRNALHCEVAHLDGNRLNASADNLKWVSRSENLSHRHQHGTDDRGERHSSARLTNAQAVEIRSLRAKRKYRELAAEYGVGLRTIHDIVYGRRYAEATIAIADDL